MGGLAGRHATAPSADSGSPDGVRLPATVTRDKSFSVAVRGTRASRRLDAAFRSPAAAARFGATSAGSSFPACTFTALRSARQPVRFRAPHSRCRAIGSRKGLLPRTPYSQRFLASSLPFGTFRSLRIAARCDSPLESLPSPNARFPSLPVASDRSAASDHRSGFAASRVARQLRKPLGTSIIVHRNRVAVNTEERLGTVFSAGLLGCGISGLP